MAESVELATILLTDLVGSTRLATSVGPVRADQLREEHFGLLRDAIRGRLAGPTARFARRGAQRSLRSVQSGAGSGEVNRCALEPTD